MSCGRAGERASGRGTAPRIGACEAAVEPMLEAIQKPEPGKAP
jgi:hypothetical protein